MKNKSPIIDALQDVFSVDLRALALFRVLIALAVITNIAILIPDWGAFLSDSGLYTRAHAVSASNPYYFSLYHVSGAAWYSLALLLLTLISAVSMLLGFHTRIATVCTWILIASLSNRITGLTSGADTQLTVLLFWAMFLPLGARFSVDASTAQEQGPNRYFSVATIAILLQVLYLYFIGALLKTGLSWTQTYEAVYFATATTHITTPLALLLSSFPEIAHWLTFYVFYLELFAIIFLFAPIIFQYTRVFILPQLIAMHIGFGLFLSIGFFPMVSIAGLVLFTPPIFWTKILLWWNGRRSRSNIIMYYDRNCDFCKKTCFIFRTLALAPTTPILLAQEDGSANHILETEGSWSVRTHHGQYLSKWRAVAYVWRRSPLLWPLGVLFTLPGFRSAGDYLYAIIARHRGTMGRFTACLVPTRHRVVFWPRRETNYILALLATLVLLWNVDTLRIGFSFPEQVKPVIWTTRLTQRWNMFAPQPAERSRWLVIEGSQAQGATVDLLHFRAQEPTHDLPRHGYEAFPGYRWRKYFSRVDLIGEREILGRYYCQRSLRFSREPITSISIYAYAMYVRHSSEGPELLTETIYPCESTSKL